MLLLSFVLQTVFQQMRSPWSQLKTSLDAISAKDSPVIRMVTLIAHYKFVIIIIQGCEAGHLVSPICRISCFFHSHLHRHPPLNFTFSLIRQIKAYLISHFSLNVSCHTPSFPIFHIIFYLFFRWICNIHNSRIIYAWSKLQFMNFPVWEYSQLHRLCDFLLLWYLIGPESPKWDCVKSLGCEMSYSVYTIYP